jgi:Ni,Fe-hydrogenase III large subunit
VTVAVETDDWRAAIARRLAGGSRFAGGWAVGSGTSAEWRVALLAPDGATEVLGCAAHDGRLPTIVDLTPAADWDEREAHDLHAVTFEGHEPMRALVAHPQDPAAWMTPVTGDGVNEVAVGPIHAGVIESGHFRFHVVGERILALDTRLFYKHRGLERAAEGGDLAAGLALAGRACAACSVTNGVAYAHAVEEALGLWPERHLRAGRTLLLELERLYNHLHDIGALCAGVGYAPGSLVFADFKDRAQRVNEALTGHRFLFRTVAVGESALVLDRSAVDSARGELRELRADAAAAWRELEFAGSLQARLDGIGVLDHDTALRLGASGPAARAAGVRTDARSHSPRLWYDSGFVPAAPREPTGDVAARLQLRAGELETTYELLDELLAHPIARGTATLRHEPRPIGLGLIESPRGATLAAVELAAGRITRMRLRTGSYANWPAVAHAAVGNLLPDFPLINKSFELCYACVDR